MHRFIVILLVLFIGFPKGEVPYPDAIMTSSDYTDYHRKVLEAEELIATGNFNAALGIYQSLFTNYSFVFVREYKIATQLAITLDKEDMALALLKEGILSGWDKKSIRKNSYLSDFLKRDETKEVMAAYTDLHRAYEKKLNDTLKDKVHQMFKKDQKLAMKAFLKLSAASQDAYAEKKFAPHSEKQLHDLKMILGQSGYPGERIIGNNVWMSTILSHHNSISQDYVLNDRLYVALRPLLVRELKKGNISPNEFALMDEWRFATMSSPTEVSYGFLEPPFADQLEKTDSLRAAIGMRSVALRNRLVEVEDKTGMNMYLFGSPWVDGKIELR